MISTSEIISDILRGEADAAAEIAMDSEGIHSFQRQWLTPSRQLEEAMKKPERARRNNFFKARREKSRQTEDCRSRRVWKELVSYYQSRIAEVKKILEYIDNRISNATMSLRWHYDHESIAIRMNLEDAKLSHENEMAMLRATLAEVRANPLECVYNPNPKARKRLLKARLQDPFFQS